jgi:hypothetical protein
MTLAESVTAVGGLAMFAALGALPQRQRACWPPRARHNGLLCSPVSHCKGRPDASRPRKGGRQTALAVGGAYDASGMRPFNPTLR